jgi:transcriptional regulator with XRE-family HTH domain
MEAIKQTRRTLGVTQAELAALLGLNQSTISRLERGSLEVDARTALALEALSARGQAAGVQ